MQLLLAALLAASSLHAADRKILSLVDLPGVPAWKNSPALSKMEDGRLTIVAGPSTDWFISPVDAKSSSSAPVLLFEPADDFVLTAKLTVESNAQWDAGALMVYRDNANWAKFALEMTIEREPTIVTLVTRGVSDDCNSAAVPDASAWFRIAKAGRAIAFYASLDGRKWKIIRAFTLGDSPNLRAGFAAQSPVGQKATATFSEITYGARTIADILKGD